MSMSTNAKTLWLLLIGAVVVAIVVIPFRLTPVVAQSIDLLPLEARARLIQRYEAPAREQQMKIDTVRLAIRRRYGGTTPSQDALFAEWGRDVAKILQITDHLRDPRRATHEERREDIARELDRLLTRSEAIARQLVEDFLH